MLSAGVTFRAGRLVDRDGEAVDFADVPTLPGDEFKYQREYPTGDLFTNVTGYYTYSFGSSSLEKTKNDVLLGDTAAPGAALAGATSSFLRLLPLNSTDAADYYLVARNAGGAVTGQVAQVSHSRYVVAHLDRKSVV